MEIFDYYPIPHPYDVKERVNNGFRLPYDLQDEIRLLFPKGKIKKKLNILIIGCGYNEAVYHALRSPKYQFTGIDISKNVCDANTKQINEYGILNLDIIQDDIFSSNLSNKYDVIICTAFISYSNNKQNIFSTLKNLVTKDGVIVLSLVSSVYDNQIKPIRNILNKMGFNYKDPESVNKAFDFVKKLDPFHPSKMAMLQVEKGKINVNKFIDLNDFALRYLNSYVKSFSVKEFIDELEDNNLYFQGWYNNSLYYTEANFSSSFNAKGAGQVNKLDVIQQWDAVCELKGPFVNHLNHLFVASLNKNNFLLSDKLLADKKSIIKLRPYQKIVKLPDSPTDYMISPNLTTMLSEDETKICKAISDYGKTIDDIMKDNKLDLSKDEIITILERLNSFSFLSIYKN